MPLKRLYKVLIVLLALLLLLALLPGIGPVRNALLRLGLERTAPQGVQLSYGLSRGNLWRGVVLEDLRAKGQGTDATVKEAAVHYQLLGLLRGKLPLKIDVSGVRGNLNLPAAEADLSKEKQATPAKGPKITPEIAHLGVQDVSLRLQGLPFKVPAARLEQLQITTAGGAYHFATAVGLRERVGRVSGTLRLEPLNVQAELERLDLGLFEDLYEGAKGGYLTGKLAYNPSGLQGALELKRAQVDVIKIALQDVHGPIRIENNRLDAALTGRAWGGEVKATATADLDKKHWQADVTGKNARLKDALVWSSMGNLSPQLARTALGAQGQADVALSLSGWQTFSLAGKATGKGRLFEQPLQDLNVAFGFTSDVGTDVQASASLGGAPLRFSLEPGQTSDVMLMRATGDALPIYQLRHDLSLALRLAPQGLNGTLNLDSKGRRWGRALQSSLRAEARNNRWNLDISGSDALGAKATGTLRFAKNQLEGTLNASKLTLEGLQQPLNAQLALRGKPQDLRSTLRLSGPQGVVPSLDGVTLAADFSGTLNAHLKRGNLVTVQGDLGPLKVRGNLEDLRYDVQPVGLEGRVNGDLALKGGRLNLAQGALNASGELQSSGLEAFSTKLPALTARYEVARTKGGRLRASVTDPAAGLGLSVQEGNLNAKLEDFSFKQGATPYRAGGTLRAKLNDLKHSLKLDLTAKSAGAANTLHLKGKDGALDYQLLGAAGSQLGGLKLAKGLNLKGQTSLKDGSTKLTGNLGELNIAVTRPAAQVNVAGAKKTSGTASVQATVSRAGERFALRYSTPSSWETNGTLSLSALGEVLALPLKGTLKSQHLASTADGFRGGANLSGSFGALPLRGHVAAMGRALKLNAQSRAANLPLKLDGKVLHTKRGVPSLDLALEQATYGSLKITGDAKQPQLSGQGRLPAFSQGGLELDAKTWNLRGDLAAGEVQLAVGGSLLRAHKAAQGWALNANLDESATFQGKPLALAGTVSQDAAHPQGEVDARLTLGDAPLALTGSFKDVRIAGEMPAKTLNANLLGKLALQGSVQPQQAAYNLRAIWQQQTPEGVRQLPLQITGKGKNLQARAEAKDLTAVYRRQGDTSSWQLQAQDFALRTLPLKMLAAQPLRLHGALRASTAQAQTRYRGSLSLQSGAPGKPISALLRAQGTTLQLDTKLTTKALAANLKGQLAPRLNLELSANAAARLRASGTFSGTLGAPKVNLALRSQRVAEGPFALAPQTLQVKAHRAPAGAWQAELEGSFLTASLQQGAWRGQLALPFRLQGERQQLSAALAGQLAAPRLTGKVTGSVLAGPLTLAPKGSSADLTLKPQLATATDTVLQAHLRAPELNNWSLSLHGHSTLNYRKLPLRIGAKVAGAGGRYQGDGKVLARGNPVTFELSGQGATLKARANAAQVNLADLSPIPGTLAGSLRVSNQDALRYQANLTAKGTQKQPLKLTLQADETRGLRLAGRVQETDVSLQSGPRFKVFTYRVVNSKLALEASGSAHLNDHPRADLSGTWRQEALRANILLSQRGPRADLHLGDAYMSVRSPNKPADRQAAATYNLMLRAPKGILAQTTPTFARAQLKGQGGRFWLTGLKGNFGPQTLSAQGALLPKLQLQSTLGLKALSAPLSLALKQHENAQGYLLQGQYQTLNLSANLARSFKPERLRLEGYLTQDHLELTSSLLWQAGSGFRGRAYLRPVGLGGLKAQLIADGKGTLNLRADARYKAQALRLAAILPRTPWQGGDLKGQVDVNAPLNKLVSGYQGRALTLSSSLKLSGSVKDPQLAGPVALRDALKAEGNLWASREGLTLRLSGNSLRSIVTVNQRGYSANLGLFNADMAPFIAPYAPQLKDATADAQLSAEQQWGGKPQVEVRKVRLETPQSRLEARGSLHESWRGIATIKASVKEFAPSLRGQLSGDVALQPSGALLGGLELQNFQPARASWRLQNALNLSGSWQDPLLRLQTTGEGSARGALSATFYPKRQQGNLRSNLAVAGVRTQLSAELKAVLIAKGSVGYRTFGVRLQPLADGTAFTGSGKLTGWRGHTSAAGTAVRGNLASLHKNLAGVVALDSAAPADMLGSVQRVRVGNFKLGSVSLRRQAGQRVRLSGENLAASLTLRPQLPWELSRLQLKLSPNTSFNLSGQGNRSQGKLKGSAHAAGQNVALKGSFAPQHMLLNAQTKAKGNLPGLVLHARYQPTANAPDGAWQGALRSQSQKGAPLVLDARLSGPLTQPQLKGKMTFSQGANKLASTFSASPQDVAFKAALQSPQLNAPLALTARGWPLEVRLQNPKSQLQLKLQGGNLQPTGHLEVKAGPALLRLRPQAQSLFVQLRAPQLDGLALNGTLPTKLAAIPKRLENWPLQGRQHTHGTLFVRAVGGAPRVKTQNLAWRTAQGGVRLKGQLAWQQGLAGTMHGELFGTRASRIPWLRQTSLPLKLSAKAQALTLRSSSPAGDLRATFNSQARALSLLGELQLGRGSFRSDLHFSPKQGPSGGVQTHNLPIYLVGQDAALLTSAFTLGGAALSGQGRLSLANSEVDVQTVLGWRSLLPKSQQPWVQQGGNSRSLTLLFNGFDPTSLPGVRSRVPYLQAPLTGRVTLDHEQVIGQLSAPLMRAAKTPLPTELDFNGTLDALELRGTLAGSILNLKLAKKPLGPNLSGLVTFNRFPLQALAEATQGTSNIRAPLTGAMRLDLPLRKPAAGYMRLATEQLSLIDSSADSGTLKAPQNFTKGNVALRYAGGSLIVERATFEGDGFWRARGIIRPDKLNFEVDAREANFTPLLQLAPQLAAFNVGAKGSFSARARGNLQDPRIRVASQGLELRVANAVYQAKDVALGLAKGRLTLDGQVSATTPFTGTLTLGGGGRLSLLPFSMNDLAFTFKGSGSVPNLGEVKAISGRIFPRNGFWLLDSSGMLGSKVTARGVLAPLDLRVTGTNLTPSAPKMFVASSNADVNLRVEGEDNQFYLSGDTLIHAARLSMNRNAATQEAQNAAKEGAAANGAAEKNGAAENSTAANSSDPNAAIANIRQTIVRSKNPFLERVHFDNFGIRAPQDIVFDEAFGNAEMSLDLTLDGTAAQPLLDGEARTLRGSIQFAGSDFELQEAIASFSPTQGPFPTLDITADAEFDKTRALGNLGELYDFVEPTGAAFDVTLRLTGKIERGISGKPALNLDPTLTSDAKIQQLGTANIRQLSESELITLLTLGRLQLDSPLAGENALAGTALTSAFDTAVDMFVVSELQNALGQALGLDYFEIRTSALSNYLSSEGAQENFGISVRFGGYIDENLFASVQVGRFNDAERSYALSNEFLLRYSAAPLEFSFEGGVNFLNNAALTAVTNFSLGFSYAITQAVSVDAALATNNLGKETSIKFGVSYGW